MNQRIHLDQHHTRAICSEIGERLRLELSHEKLALPKSMLDRLNRLRELDDDFSPPLAPSMGQH